jgi:hypothetical protein
VPLPLSGAGTPRNTLAADDRGGESSRHDDRGGGPTVNGERYEAAKARLDLLEAEAELAAATTSSAMVMALDRADDARYRLARWSGGVED